jgi:hypothetical protein
MKVVVFLSVLIFILLGKWNTMNSSDVYNENWFHGKINREEVILGFGKRTLYKY